MNRYLSLFLLPLVTMSHGLDLPSSRGHPPQTIPDSVRVRVSSDYEIGRFWHGVSRLREALDGALPEDEESLLLLAEGEVGWGNWEGARNVLAENLASGRVSGPLAWFILGRALEETGDVQGADEAFTRVLTAMAGGEGKPGSADAEEVHLRRARLRLRGTSPAGAAADLDAVLEGDSSRGSWLALELARKAAEDGAPAATLTFLSKVTPLEVRQRGWDLPARSLLVSGDSAGAEAAYWSVIASLPEASERAQAWEQVGELRSARGDSVGARAAFHQVLREDPRGNLAAAAATALVGLGFDSASVALVGAQALAGAGNARDALVAYGAYDDLRGGPRPSEVTQAMARVLLSLDEPREALDLLDAMEEGGAEGASATVLILRSQALGALGRRPEAIAIQDSLIAAYPDRPESVEVLYLRAVALQDRGNIPGAIQGLEATAALSPSQSLAGQARMRLGQLYLSRGEEPAAIEVFRDYLEAFPDGRRWDEAAFWAGRTLLSQGVEGEGRELLEQLRTRFGLSYYSVQAGALLGLSYQPEIPPAASPPPDPAWVSEGLARVDLLLRAELPEGAGWEVDRLARRIREMEAPADRRGLLLRLALELNERGLTREGINLGWEVRRLGGDWDRDLLKAVYPFPYQALVLREAQERGLDPFLMAGLIRQESAFWREALSRADARGLMQVLPATGAELARSRGPRGFAADEHLYRPEINVHLGMAFFSDLQRRFGDDLSILLSAYNAGPTRARRWREYPEAGDLTRFVERIPFTETRGYVKNVLLNREIYAWLYGTGDDGPEPLS